MNSSDLSCDPATRLLSLREVLVALRRDYGVDCRYSRLWSRVAEGLVPVERGTHGWLVPAAALPEIAIAVRRRPAA